MRIAVSLLENQLQLIIHGWRDDRAVLQTKLREWNDLYEVEIVNEISIPVDDWVSDLVTTLAAENLDISTQKAKEALGSVASVKVKGVKIN